LVCQISRKLHINCDLLKKLTFKVHNHISNLHFILSCNYSPLYSNACYYLCYIRNNNSSSDILLTTNNNDWRMFFYPRTWFLSVKWSLGILILFFNSNLTLRFFNWFFMEKCSTRITVNINLNIFICDHIII